MIRWFLLIAACLLVVMYVEEVPAQGIVVINPPAAPTVPGGPTLLTPSIVCVPIDLGGGTIYWSCT